MIRQLKRLAVQLIAGANVASVIVMLVVGFSDRIHPAAHASFASVGMVFPFCLLINMGFLFFWLVFKWRMAWIPVVGFVLAYVPIRIYMPLHLPQTVPDGAIKVLSYNVESYSGDPRYTDSFDMIFQYLKAQQADIVCLQEDIDSWRKSRVFYKDIYAYNDTAHVGYTQQNALGFHTNYPVVRRERIPYKSKGNGSVAYWLRIDGDTVIVINNHFESTHLSKNDRSMYKKMLQGHVKQDTVRAESRKLLSTLTESAVKRAMEVDKVCDYVAAHDRYSIILCGDFNDTPISYARHRVAQQLRDCFVESGRGLGLSYNRKEFSFRIDHVFCSADIQPFNCTVDSKIDASDHYPVVCWLKIKRKP